MSDTVAHDFHVRRYHRHDKGSKHVWQGRFKVFPVHFEECCFTALRYVERNPLKQKFDTGSVLKTDEGSFDQHFSVEWQDQSKGIIFVRLLDP